jgi:peroxiredoxin
MVSLTTPICDFGWQAPDFNLPNVDGNSYSLADVKGNKGTLVMFICNHCPYVKAILPRLVSDINALQTLGVNTVAIMSNDPADYPEDSFDNMQAMAKKFGFTFPYLLDESQQTAKNYGAICTPDFFGFNAQLQLQYRGRFDESRKETAPESTRDLFFAMQQIAETGEGPTTQIPSIGCSIKWKEVLGNTE